MANDTTDIADAKVVERAEGNTGKSSYLVSLEVIGGGNCGLVQKGWHPTSGSEVAVKRLQRDAACPIRFLELWAGNWAVPLHIEGHAPARGRTAFPWSGKLFFPSSNDFGARPFEAGSVEGLVLLLRRGQVGFAAKLEHAKLGGAIAAVFINTADRSEVYALGGEADASPPLPSVMVSKSEGELMATASEAFLEVRTDAEHELAICASLAPHPNVVRILDVWQEGSGLSVAAVIVMELHLGGPLRGPCSVTDALRLLRGALQGLAHLHGHGVVHRDLKPENLLLTGSVHDAASQVVIVDFSMASRARRMTVPCGSPRYLAPEVLHGGTYGPERDLWSVGVLAHELLFEGHLYGGLPDELLLERVRSPDPVVLLDDAQLSRVVPLMARAFVEALLLKDPSVRISAADAAAHQAFDLAVQRP